MRTVRLLTAAILATTGLVVVGVTTEAAQAAGSKNLSISPSSPMKNETFATYGTLTTAIARPVKIQFKSGSHWNTLGTVTSASNGSFERSTHTGSSRTYRYLAPKVKISGHTYAAITGSSKHVTLATQTVKTFFVTPYSQCTIFAGDVTAVAQFSPARPGRAVTFTTHGGPVTGYEDAKGNVAVTFDPGSSAFSYSAVATAETANGAAAKSSLPFRYQLVLCEF
jgi:hypothetical protein